MPVNIQNFYAEYICREHYKSSEQTNYARRETYLVNTSREFNNIFLKTNLEVQVLIFISPRNKVVWLYPQALGSLFVASYDLQGYNGGILPNLHTG
jgi:hypothetical protein